MVLTRSIYCILERTSRGSSVCGATRGGGCRCTRGARTCRPSTSRRAVCLGGRPGPTPPPSSPAPRPPARPHSPRAPKGVSTVNTVSTVSTMNLGRIHTRRVPLKVPI
eukprot:1190715-Prorocentrum_minimum.AAC.2